MGKYSITFMVSAHTRVIEEIASWSFKIEKIFTPDVIYNPCNAALAQYTCSKVSTHK